MFDYVTNSTDNHVMNSQESALRARENEKKLAMLFGEYRAAHNASQKSRQGSMLLRVLFGLRIF
jgi:hypothetical protein